MSSERRRRVAGIHQAVAVDVLRIGARAAGGAAFGIGLAQHDGQLRVFGKLRDGFQALCTSTISLLSPMRTCPSTTRGGPLA